MKKILFLYVLLLLNSTLFSQTGIRSEEGKSYHEIAKKAMEKLDPADFKNGILYDKVFSWSSLCVFNQNGRKDTSNYTHFFQAWHELYMASEKPDFIDAKTAKEVAYHFERKNVVQIGIINVDFTVLDSTSLKSGKNLLNVVDNKLEKVKEKNPYIDKQAFIVSPVVESMAGASGEVVFNFGVVELNKTENPLTSLTMIVENTSFEIIKNGKKIIAEAKVVFKSNGTKTIKFVCKFKNGNPITTYGSFNISKLPELKTKSASIMGNVSPIYPITATKPFTGYDENNGSIYLDPQNGHGPYSEYGKGEYKIFYGVNNNNNKLMKPFIIVDGFDPGDTRKIESDKIDNSIYTGGLIIDRYLNQDPKILLGEELRKKGYDVIILSFPKYYIGWKLTNGLLIDIYRDGGADYIERNAKVLEELITQVNSQLVANGSSEKLVVAGPSMGALVTQYALREMELDGKNHNTRLWISFDGPHNGANISIGFQGIISYTGLLENLIDNPAAKQMLIDHYLAGNSHGYPTGAPNFRDRFQNHLNSLGFPTQTRNIAVLNGSLPGTTIGSPTNRIVRVEYVSGLLATGLSAYQATKAICNIFYTPSSGNSRVFEFRVEAFWGLYNSINVNYFASSYSSPGSIDCSPGGYFPLKERFLAQTQGYTSTGGFLSSFLGLPSSSFIASIFGCASIQLFDNFNFMPIKSTLKYAGNSPVYSYNLGNRNMTVSGETPFHSYYGPKENQEHSSVHSAGVSWLMEELNKNYQTPSVYLNEFDLPSGNTLCIGSNVNYNFTTTKLPENVIWSASPNIQIVSYSGNDVTVRGVTGGSGWLKATWISGNNSMELLNAQMKVFSPTLTGTINYSQPLSYYNYVGVASWNYIEATCPGATSINWSLSSSNGNPYWNTYGYGETSNMEIYFPDYTGYAQFNVTITSQCGTTNQTIIFYPGYSYYAFAMSPNPASDFLKIDRLIKGKTINEAILKPIEVKPSQNKIVNLKSANIKIEPDKEQFKIELHSEKGGLLYSKTTFDNSLGIDLTKYPPGMYFIHILTPTEEYKEKILIKR